MPTVHQYQIAKPGSLNRLQLIETHLPAPESHEVSIAVKCIGLNFADIFAIQGLYSATADGPFVPGLEYSGEVVAVGEEVTDFRVGARVMGGTR